MLGGLDREVFYLLFFFQHIMKEIRRRVTEGQKNKLPNIVLYTDIVM
jgi:hypothetical protein